MNYDVVVIGAGLSGLMAAIASAERGKKTVIVSRGIGIITIFTGAIDVLGYYPGDVKDPITSPIKGIEELIGKIPSHPYARVGVDFIKDGIASFLDATKDGGIEYVGDVSHNFLVPTAVGTIKPTSLLSPTMVSGDLREPGDVLIAGFSGLKDFYPAYMAHNISTVRVKGIRLPHFRGRVLDVDEASGSSGLNSLTLAGKFESPTFLKMIADSLYRTVRDGERIAMPAVLGLLKFKEVHKKIEELIGTKVFETPTLPPSVGGYRLFKALEKKLRGLGVRMLLGYEVSSPRIEGKRIREVTIGMGKVESKIEGKAFVLATGGLVGSGVISTRSKLKEPLFDLPVSFPKKRSDWFEKFFFDPSGHPINKAGIEIDDELRPIEDGKKPIFENLFVTGAELAGFDAIREKSGGGVAIASGHKAGILSVDISK